MKIKNKIIMSLLIYLAMGILIGKVSELDKVFYFLVIYLLSALILGKVLVVLINDDRLKEDKIMTKARKKFKKEITKNYLNNQNNKRRYKNG